MRGFTLIEVMVSAGLMGIGFAGVVGAVSSASAQMEHQRHVTQAVHAAESMMEDLLTRRRNDPDLAIGTVSDGPDFNEVAERRPTGRYQTSWNVVAESGALDQLKRIELTVSWDERGERKSLSFETLRR